MLNLWCSLGKRLRCYCALLVITGVACSGHDVLPSADTFRLDAPRDDAETSAFVDLFETGPNTDAPEVVADWRPEGEASDKTEGFETTEAWLDAPEPFVCEPGAITCKHGVVATCNPVGSGFSYSACPPGEFCERDGACTANRAYLYVLHPNYRSVPNPAPSAAARAAGEQRAAREPTHSPMYEAVIADVTQTPGTECQTENLGEAILTEELVSRFLLKRLFLRLKEYGERTHVALFKAPAVEASWPETATDVLACAPVRSGYACRRDDGLLSVSCAMSGETYPEPTFFGPPWETPGDADGWFLTNVNEILLFPLTVASDPALEDRWRPWVDYVQEWASLGVDCESQSDCLEGACVAGTCSTHTNPELVAPLWDGWGGTYGVELFRVGEYIRHVVRVEGKPCATDGDCGNSDYRCVHEACHDEARSCRVHRVVVLFSGGEWLPYGQGWHIAEQAYRLHYGSQCENDSDCFNGAKCTAGSPFDVCLPKGLSTEPYNGVNLYSAGIYPWHLESPGKEAFAIDVDVVHQPVAFQPTTDPTMGSGNYAKHVAELGGGNYWSSSMEIGPDWETGYDSFIGRVVSSVSEKVCDVPPDDPL